MKKVLLLFAHPVLEKSRVNRRLAAAVRELKGVTFCDLYEQYPEFDIDVKRPKSPALCPSPSRKHRRGFSSLPTPSNRSRWI